MTALWEKQAVPRFPDYDLGEWYHSDCTQGYCLTSERAGSPGLCSCPSSFALKKPRWVQPSPPGVPEDEHWEQGCFSRADCVVAVLLGGQKRLSVCVIVAATAANVYQAPSLPLHSALSSSVHPCYVFCVDLSNWSKVSGCGFQIWSRVGPESLGWCSRSKALLPTAPRGGEWLCHSKKHPQLRCEVRCTQLGLSCWLTAN